MSDETDRRYKGEVGIFRLWPRNGRAKARLADGTVVDITEAQFEAIKREIERRSAELQAAIAGGTDREFVSGIILRHL